MKYFNLWNFRKVDTSLPLYMSEEAEIASIWLIEHILDPIHDEYMDKFHIQDGYKYENGILTINLTTRKGNYKNKKLYETIKKMQKDSKITFNELTNVYGYSWLVFSSYTLDNYHKNKNKYSEIG